MLNSNPSSYLLFFGRIKEVKKKKKKKKKSEQSFFFFLVGESRGFLASDRLLLRTNDRSLALGLGYTLGGLKDGSGLGSGGLGVEEGVCSGKPPSYNTTEEAASRRSSSSSSSSSSMGIIIINNNK